MGRFAKIIPPCVIIWSVLVFCQPFAPADTINIVFAGDVMLARSVGKIIDENGVDYPFAAVKNIFDSADISVVNLECVVGTQTRHIRKKWVFQARPSVLIGLVRAGIDCVSLANNHNYDFFGAGVVETVDSVWAAGIVPVGAGRNAEEFFAPRSFYVNGEWFTIFGLNDTKSGYWGDDEPGCAPTWKASGESRAISQIKAMNKLGARVIVFEHWGREYDTIPQIRQVELAHKFIDAGAVIVVGAHPHRLQGIEFYRNGIIAYSLGNFIFDQRDSLGNIGALLKISTADGKILSAKIIPTETLTNFAQPHPYPVKYAEKLWKKLCRPFNTKVMAEGSFLSIKPEQE